MYVADEDNYKIETEDYNYSSEESKKRNKKQRKNKNFFRVIIVIVIAIISGLSVYFISNLFFGKTTPVTEENKEEKLSLEDSKVKDLYAYVTRKTKGIRDSKFIKNKSVKLENFSNYDKFYYALNFATDSDFREIKNTNDAATKSYAISSDTIKLYMKKFFGSKIKYTKNSNISMTFNFDFDEKNTVNLSYDKAQDAYIGSFSHHENITPTNFIEPYYYSLVKATKKEDSTIILKEKIIFIDIISNNDEKYSYNVYKDYEHTILLDTKTDIPKSELEQNPISVLDYKKEAATITYTFKLETPGDYYFYSSKISD